MTVSNQNARMDYVGTGTVASFPFTFRIFADTDLVVTKTDADGVRITLALNSEYTVTGVGSYNGGNVVLTAALESGYTLTVRRVLPLTQQVDLRNQGAFFAETHEDALDRLTMILQQQDSILGGVLRVRPEDTDTVSTELPAPVASSLIGFNAKADGMDVYRLIDSGLAAAGNQTLDRYIAGSGFTAGSTTQLTLTRDPGTKNATTVTFDGVVQHKSTYGISGTVVTFTSAIPLGTTEVEIVTVTTLAIGVPADGSDASSFNVTASGSSFGRTLASRSSDIANVKDYGASGNGVTDDRASIQAALNSGKRVVYFPGGTYLIGADGLIGASGQVWRGDGRDRTAIKMAAAPIADMVYFTGCYNFAIEDITFDGNAQLTGGTSHFSPAYLPCIYVVSSHDFAVQRCGFKGFSTVGFLGNVVYRAAITDNVADRGAASTAINTGLSISGDIGAESYQITIARNTCIYCQISVNCHDSTITENLVSGWGFSAGINTQAHPISYNLVIANNLCFNSNQADDASPYSPAGIENWAAHSVIKGNICFGNYGDGIDQGGANCIVEGNICYNNKAYGIYSLRQDATYNASNSTCRNNQLFDTRAGGSRTQVAGYAEQAGGLTGILFADNVCRNNLGANVFNCTGRNTGANYDWIVPTLLNSWVNFGGGTGADAGYYKDADGTVHLKGLIKSGTIPGSAFNLPSGFRPAAPIYLPIASNNAFGLAIVTAGGDVIVQAGNNTYADIGGIRFRAA